MVYLKIKMPEQQSVWWLDILNWFKDNAIVVGSLGLGWKALDKGFKFLADGREAEIRKVVQDEMKNSVGPEIKNLADAVNELRESIWTLKDKK